FRWAVSEDQRPPRPDVIDIFLTVDVPDVGAIATVDERRLPTHRAKCTNRRVHASGNHLQRTIEELFGFGHGLSGRSMSIDGRSQIGCPKRQVRALTVPHPALRVTFSRREKDSPRLFSLTWTLQYVG